jgi:putative NIF3 family GTP cyclohydrolase 1 type 2
MDHISRREFAALVATGVVAGRIASPLASGQGPSSGSLTAADIIDRIRKNIGGEWKADTVDTVKAGDASTRVTGVVTTSLASMAVLQQAVKAGANLVVTFEPTFFSRSDATTPPAGRGGGRGAAGAPAGPPPAPPPPDPIFTAKNDFIAKNNLVVFRLSDHWRARTPDPLAVGFGRSLGWTEYQAADDARRFDVPAITLDALATTLKKTLQARGGMRVIGDPQARVRRIGLLPGSTPIQASIAMMPNVDVIVAGEVREWESVEYVRDVVFSGQGKGLILVGRVASEEPGMAVCADWIRTFVPEVSVRHLSAGDPYWRPA